MKRKQIMSKRKVEKMRQKDKYSRIDEEAADKIEAADPSDKLKLTIESNSPTEIVDAERIADREDLIKAFKK